MTRLPAGPFDPKTLAEGAPAICIVDGLVSRDIAIGARHAVDLLGPGDCIPVEDAVDDFLSPDLLWTAMTPLELVVLDDSAMRRITDPSRLLRNAAEQGRRSALHRALTQLPRIEDRIIGVLWLIAGRWGRVAAEGVVVPLPFTHEIIGRLTGARRSTVSIALKELAADGLVLRREDGSWLLANGSQDRIAVRPLPALPEIRTVFRAAGAPPATAA